MNDSQLVALMATLLYPLFNQRRDSTKHDDIADAIGRAKDILEESKRGVNGV